MHSAMEILFICIFEMYISGEKVAALQGNQEETLDSCARRILIQGVYERACFFGGVCV